MKTSAIVDTGASTTCIPLKLVDSLALVPIGAVDITSPSGSEKAMIYLVEIGIERLGYFNQQVVGVEFDTVLLGRDILSKFSVLIDADGGMSFYRKRSLTPAATP